MKLTYTTKNGSMTIELEGKTQVDLMEQLASFQEVFEQKCVVKDEDGKFTESDDVRAVVRNVTSEGKEYTYYEWRVNSGPLRGYKLALGCHQKGGGLFPKRKDDEGKWLENNGWTKWSGKEQKESKPVAKEDGVPF